MRKRKTTDRNVEKKNLKKKKETKNICLVTSALNHLFSLKKVRRRSPDRLSLSLSLLVRVRVRGRSAVPWISKAQ